MCKRTNIPTSYSAGTGAGPLRHPWDSRSWLRDSTKILWRRSEFYPADNSCWNPLLLGFLKNVQKPFTHYPVGAFGQTHSTGYLEELR